MIPDQQGICVVIPQFAEDMPLGFRHLFDFVDALAETHRVCVVIERHAGCPQFQRVQNVVLLRHQNRVFRFAELLWTLIRQRAQGYRTFYVHYSYLGCLAAGIVRRLSGGRVLYWHCGRLVEFVRDLPSWLRVYVVFNAVLRAADFLVTGNPAMARYYNEHFLIGVKRILLVPSYINLERFQDATSNRAKYREAWDIPNEQHVVLFAHRLSGYRGDHYLTRIASEVLSRHPDTLFLVAGDGPARQRLEQDIQDAKLGRTFRLLGWVPNERMHEIFALADVFILPSDLAGFPRNLLEAQAAGLPFVAMKAGGVSEVVLQEQHRALVEVGDWEEFSKRLINILGDPALSRTLSGFGLVNVQQYGIPAVQKQFLKAVLGSN